MLKSYEDAFNLLCGELLGEGIHRKVFACRIRPDLVVKVEYNEDYRYFANVMESEFWSEYQYNKDVIKWLAPIEFMSPDGRILLQKKCDPIPSNYKLPTKLPEFLTDIKRKNFGILDGKLVCVDYALTILNPGTKQRKVDWL